MQAEENKWELFISYWRAHAAGWGAALLFALIGAVVFFLYAEKTEAVLYALVLWLAGAAVIFAVSFLRYRRTCRYLRQRAKTIVTEIPEASDVPKEAQALLYVGLLRILWEENRSNRTALEAFKRETNDYYTAWVHEIKTPLSVLRLELQQEDSDRAHALLGQLQRVEDYVGMALCFARLTPDASDLLYRRQRLDPIVKAAARKYSSFFVSKNISFVYKDTGAEILTDEKWLGFLLEQLLSNAVKYTERGEVAVFLDENQVLHVKDTGIGIAPEELPRIFDKGFTGGNGRAQQRSTGLGLYLSQRAAERIGAVLTVQSEVGKGSDFRIDLSESQRAALQK